MHSTEMGSSCPVGQSFEPWAWGLAGNCFSILSPGRCISYGLSDIPLDQAAIYLLQWLTQECLLILVLPHPCFIYFPVPHPYSLGSHSQEKSLCQGFPSRELGLTHSAVDSGPEVGLCPCCPEMYLFLSCF